MIQKYGNLSFPDFAQLIITESEQYEEMDITEVNVHWRPFYLSPCTFCDVPFTGIKESQKVSWTRQKSGRCFTYLPNNQFLLVIAKTEQLFDDMKFIGQMANISFAASLGDEVFFKNISKR